MSGNEYRAGVIGCGEIGRTHVELYREHERTDLVAVADVNPDALETVGDRFSVAGTYETHERLLAEEDLDVVSICTWHATHADVTIDAAESGVDGIFCEKPMATSLGEAEEMIRAAERNGAKLTVEHNRRFDPVNEKARALIADGAIGDPQVAVASTTDGLLNWGTHMIDHARYLLGDPETEWVIGQIERETDRYERGEPIEDRCVGQVGLGNGAQLTFECDLPDSELLGEPNTLVVYGSEGQIVPRSPLTVINGEGRTELSPEADRTGKVAHLDELIEWMEGDRSDHRCSGVQARNTVEIMMSIYESLRTTGLVRTPLRTRANPLKVMLDAGDLSPDHPGKYDIRIPYDP